MKAFNNHFEVIDALKKKELTCVQWLEHHLSIIEENKHLNVFLEVFKESALKQAKTIDEEINGGKIKPLAGLIVGIKDLFCYKDHRVEAASKILEGFVSQYSATCVERLIDNGAIIIGRQNCDEFAMGSSSENSAYCITKNGLDETRVPGGSSGAGAVSVQTGMCQIALGTDTGGSVRQPASFCGIIGMKPTYSRISRYGVVAYASSFDVIGIFSRTLEDNALVLEKISGFDSMDSTCTKRPIDKYTITNVSNGKSIKPKKIAYINDIIDHELMRKETQQIFLRKVEALKKQGHTVEAVPFGLLDYLLPIYYILTSAECSSNLARYDGVRYGYRTNDPQDLDELYFKSRSEGFGEEVKKRILLGTFVLSSDYYDAFYVKAQKSRQKVKQDTGKLLEKYDFLISPTTVRTAFKIGELNDDPIAMCFEDLLTVQANIVGVPSISIPFEEKIDGMPIGLNILGNYFKENELYNFANSIN